MRSRWPARVFRGLLIAFLVLLIVGITTATLMPVIYNTEWFQKQFVKSPQ